MAKRFIPHYSELKEILLKYNEHNHPHEDIEHFAVSMQFDCANAKMRIANSVCKVTDDELLRIRRDGCVKEIIRLEKAALSVDKHRCEDAQAYLRMLNGSKILERYNDAWRLCSRETEDTIYSFAPKIPQKGWVLDQLDHGNAYYGQVFLKGELIQQICIPMPHVALPFIKEAREYIIAKNTRILAGRKADPDIREFCRVSRDVYEYITGRRAYRQNRNGGLFKPGSFDAFLNEVARLYGIGISLGSEASALRFIGNDKSLMMNSFVKSKQQKSKKL